jgi:hypothetical protein
MLEAPDPCRIVAMTADQERERIVVATDTSRSAAERHEPPSATSSGV